LVICDRKYARYIVSLTARNYEKSNYIIKHENPHLSMACILDVFQNSEYAFTKEINGEPFF